MQINPTQGAHINIIAHIFNKDKTNYVKAFFHAIAQ